MKNLIYLFLIGIVIGTLSSCASVSNVADDDVYVTKGVEIPIDESLNDETSYTAYKYKKDRDNISTQYVTNNNYYGHTSYGSSNYGYSPFYGGSFYQRQWSYAPGFGWTYVGFIPYGGGMGFGYGMNYGYSPYSYSPYGYSPYNYGHHHGHYHGYGGLYNPYGHYGYNPYGSYYGGYYGGHYGGYGYNPYGYYPYNNGNDYGYNNSNSNTGGSWGNATNASSNHFRGPRGSSSGGGVITRNDLPGTVKSGKANGNIHSTVVGVTNSQAGKDGLKESKMIVNSVSKENIVVRNVNPSIGKNVKEVKSAEPTIFSPTTVSPVRGNPDRQTEQKIITPDRVTPTRVTPPNTKVVTPIQRTITPSNNNNVVTPSRSNPTIQRQVTPTQRGNSGTIRNTQPVRNHTQPAQRTSPSMNNNQQQSRPTPSTVSPSRGSGSSGTARPSGNSRPSGGR